MIRSKISKIVLVTAAVICLCYLAYDNYFRLPAVNTPPAGGAQEEPKAEFDKFNVLLLGLDGRAGVNNRADTIILASFDGETNEAQLLSVPRDTRVKIKGGWDKVNAAYAYGGVELTRQTLADFLDISIDRYVVVDFDSLVKLVDEVGGIEVDVPVRMYVPLEGIDLEPGIQHLNGEQVLAYSRFRGTIESDIGRIKRQQQVIQLLAQKLLSSQNLARLPQLISDFKDEVTTDLTVREMVALARFAPGALEKGVNAQVLPGSNKKIDGIWYWEPNIEALAKILTIPISTNIAHS